MVFVIEYLTTNKRVNYRSPLTRPARRLVHKIGVPKSSNYTMKELTISSSPYVQPPRQLKPTRSSFYITIFVHVVLPFFWCQCVMQIESVELFFSFQSQISGFSHEQLGGILVGLARNFGFDDRAIWLNYL